MTVDGSVRTLRHTAVDALRGEPGLSKEEQLARLDAAAEAVASARAIVAEREVANGEPVEDESDEVDFSVEDDDEE